MNNGVIILSYCEMDELHLLFLPLKPWLTRCSSAPCTADLSIPHAAGRRIQRALEPGHYRAHSACSNAEARSSSKWYGEFLVADQSCEKLPFFFFLVLLFFLSSLVSRRHRGFLQRAPWADSEAEQPSSAQHLRGQWGPQHRSRAEARLPAFLHPFHLLLSSLVLWT